MYICEATHRYCNVASVGNQQVLIALSSGLKFDL